MIQKKRNVEKGREREISKANETQNEKCKEREGERETYRMKHTERNLEETKDRKT